MTTIQIVILLSAFVYLVSTAIALLTNEKIEFPNSLWGIIKAMILTFGAMCLIVCIVTTLLMALEDHVAPPEYEPVEETLYRKTN